MSDALYAVATNAAVPLVANTAKTVLFIVAPSGHGMSLKKFSIGFDGVTASAVPVFWEVNALTAASNSTPGTGNTSQSANVTQISGLRITSAFLAGSNCSAEPTVQTFARANLLTPNGGVLLYDIPLGDEPDNVASAGFAIRLTAPAAVNVRVDAVFKRI